MSSGFNVGAGNGSLGLMHEIAKPENRSWVNIMSIAVQSAERELGYFISATALSWPSLVSVENAWGEVFDVQQLDHNCDDRCSGIQAATTIALET